MAYLGIGGYHRGRDTFHNETFYIDIAPYDYKTARFFTESRDAIQDVLPLESIVSLRIEYRI